MPYKPSYSERKYPRGRKPSHSESDNGLLPELIDTYNEFSNLDVILLNRQAPILPRLIYFSNAFFALILFILLILLFI